MFANIPENKKEFAEISENNPYNFGSPNCPLNCRLPPKIQKYINRSKMPFSAALQLATNFRLSPIKNS